MCRMVGIVFRREVPMEWLDDLRHVSEVGMIPDEKRPGHRDGWGMVSFMNGSPRYIGRSTREAFLDPSFDSALREIPKISPPSILMAHVRALSKGQASLPNTHPFVMGGLALAHNGTVEDYHPKIRHMPKGETDSELLLARLMDLMEEKKDLRSSVKVLVKEDISTHKYSAAILLVSDGKKLYGYRDFYPGRSSEYYALRISRSADSVVLFQQSFLDQDCELPELRSGELAIVDTGLNIEREMLR